MFHRCDFFRFCGCQMQACTIMTGLRTGPLMGAAGLDAVRADLASAVPHVPGPRPRLAADQPLRPGLAEPRAPLAPAITG